MRTFSAPAVDRYLRRIEAEQPKPQGRICDGCNLSRCEREFVHPAANVEFVNCIVCRDKGRNRETRRK